MIKVLQAEDSDTVWAVSKHVMSKETEILLPVPSYRSCQWHRMLEVELLAPVGPFLTCEYVEYA